MKQINLNCDFEKAQDALVTSFFISFILCASNAMSVSYKNEITSIIYCGNGLLIYHQSLKWLWHEADGNASITILQHIQDKDRVNQSIVLQ